MKMHWMIFVALITALILLTGCTLGIQPASTVTVTACPPGKDCSTRSLTATAAAVTPVASDLGWGEVRGRVSDTIDNSPIAGAQVTCKHRSNHPVSLCSGTVVTASDGSYVFPHVFFQATDQIELAVSEPGHGPQGFLQSFFKSPGLYVNFSLPVVDLTPHPCCTAPACRENEVYSCPGVCPCGCGTTCATKTAPPNGSPTQTPYITPTPISYACVDCADPRNALRDFCPLAGNDQVARALLGPYGEIDEATLRDHTCLYVLVPGAPSGILYYVNQANSTVTKIYITPSLLNPTPTPLK